MVTIVFTNKVLGGRGNLGQSALKRPSDPDVEARTLSTEYRVLSLEIEGKSAPDRAGGIHQIDRLAVLAENRDVSLGQQVADIYEKFHMARD